MATVSPARGTCLPQRSHLGKGEGCSSNIPMLSPQCCWLKLFWSPCDLSWLVGWLILLPSGVVWDIMGHESYPLPLYPELSNCSYSVNLITPLPGLCLWFISHVLIPPEHHTYRPCYLLRLRAQCIDGAAGHPIHYVFCRVLMYTPMGWIPAVYITSSTSGYSHSPPAPRFPSSP